MKKSQYPSLPAERWVGNYKVDRLHTWFYDAGGLVGTPRRPDRTEDPSQEDKGFVGVFAPDASTADRWRGMDISDKATFNLY